MTDSEMYLGQSLEYAAQTIARAAGVIPRLTAPGWPDLNAIGQARALDSMIAGLNETRDAANKALEAATRARAAIEQTQKGADS